MSELGTKLRDARIEKGYTLNTLQQMTKIQKKYLQAIEEGHYDEMPGSFYVRAFVKQYADMVGLDGDLLLDEYGEEIAARASSGQLDHSRDETPLPSRVERHIAKEKNSLDALMSYLPLVILVGIVLAIMIALIVAINSIGKDSEVAESQVETNEIVSSVAPNEVITESETISVEKTTEESLSENDLKVGKEVITLVSNPGEETVYQLNAPFSKYRFEFKGNSFVWVGAFQDGIIALDTTIVEDETLEFEVAPGTQELRLTLGYPEGADFMVNGVKVEPEGQYLRETLIFILADEVESEEEMMSLSLPEDESQTTVQEEQETTVAGQ